jgi:hypothetical protein
VSDAGLECRCLGTTMDAGCFEEATEEDGLCDTCRANDCMGKGRLEQVRTYRKLATFFPGERYWGAKAEALEARTP